MAKPEKQKRKPVTGSTTQSQIMAAAKKDIQPPDHMPLTEDEMLFFKNIINEIAKAFWTPHQIELASALARTMHMLNLNQQQMRIEGSIIKNAKGNPVISPREKLINDCYDRIIAMRRSLSIHARAQGVNKEDMARRNDKAKEIEEMAQHADDDLIARPALN